MIWCFKSDIFISLIGIQNWVQCNYNTVFWQCFLYNNGSSHKFSITKLAFFLWVKQTVGYMPVEISKLIFDSPPLSFNCFLSYTVSKQRVASWLTSTALQVCRQLGKPLCLVLFPAAVLLRAGEWWCLLISTDVGSSHVWPKAPRQSKISQEK